MDRPGFSESFSHAQWSRVTEANEGGGHSAQNLRGTAKPTVNEENIVIWTSRSMILVHDSIEMFCLDLGVESDLEIVWTQFGTFYCVTVYECKICLASVMLIGIESVVNQDFCKRTPHALDPNRRILKAVLCQQGDSPCDNTETSPCQERVLQTIVQDHKGAW